MKKFQPVPPTPKPMINTLSLRKEELCIKLVRVNNKKKKKKMYQEIAKSTLRPGLSLILIKEEQGQKLVATSDQIEKEPNFPGVALDSLLSRNPYWRAV